MFVCFSCQRRKCSLLQLNTDRPMWVRPKLGEVGLLRLVNILVHFAISDCLSCLHSSLCQLNILGVLCLFLAGQDYQAEIARKEEQIKDFKSQLQLQNSEIKGKVMQDYQES